MDVHAEELREMWKGFDNYLPDFCGDEDPHVPHDACMGIMCDFGCNAEYF